MPINRGGMRRMPNKREIARARRMVQDPAFQLAFATHSLLQHCYGNMPREERHKIYAQAGIPDLLRRAEKRTKSTRA